MWKRRKIQLGQSGKGAEMTWDKQGRIVRAWHKNMKWGVNLALSGSRKTKQKYSLTTIINIERVFECLG